jgi:arsenate reductase (glutaredoxin)
VDPGLTVYEKPTCSTCRRLFDLLTGRGVDFERVDYHVEPLPEQKIPRAAGEGGVEAGGRVAR